MIGIDTNILVRYLTQDDPAESLRATRIMEERLTVDAPGFVSLVTLAETVWVLQRSYGLTPIAVTSVIERLLQSENLVIQNEREVSLAMAAVQSGAPSFSDALIGALGAWAGCSTTLTFDRRAAARLAQFTLA